MTGTTTTHRHAETNAGAAALRVEHVRFTYPGRRGQQPFEALRGVDLTIPAGQTVAMLGPNGSGKSTLMKLISGLLPLQHNGGSISVFGSQNIRDIRRQIGVVFQNEGLDRHMTVFENLRDQASLYGLRGEKAKAIIDEELAHADLMDRRNALVKTLSKGLARRVDLCRAVLHRPRLLMLDEPTVGLDPTARERFLNQLEQWRNQRSLTVLMSTHLVDEADRHDRVVLMHQGQLVADDSPANLRRQAGVRRVTVMDTHWQPPAETREKWRRSSTGWIFRLEANGEQARQLAAQLTDAGVPYSMAPPTLADVFEHLTGASLHDESDAASESAQQSMEAAQ